LRERSYSRLLTLEAARLLDYLGAETRVFDPHGLPLPDGAPADHPKVAELRALSAWSEGQAESLRAIRRRRPDDTVALQRRPVR
jgi:arsenic resistance protein ArsH